MKENCAKNIISVASLPAPKYELYSVLKKGELLHVWDAVLIRLLSEVFRVPYQVLIPPDEEWGKMLPDGNWTGLIGMVKRSEADLAVGGIALLDKRFHAVTFSYPYLFSKMTFMTDKPKPLSTSLALIYPFSLKLWILIAITIFSVSYILFIVTNRKQAFQSVLFKVFGLLLEKAVRIRVLKKSIGLLLSTWLLFIYVVTSSYKALLLSFLSIPTLTGIQNIADLSKAAEQNSVSCYTYKGHSFPQILLESEFESWRIIGKCLQRNPITSGDPKELFVKASSNKAFFGGKIFMMRVEKNYLISEDSFFNVMFAIPISKNFCHRDKLNEVIHRLFAAGLFTKHSKDEEMAFELYRSPYDKIELNTQKVIGIDDIRGAFLLLICGNILALIVLVIEIFVKYYYSK